MMARAIAIGGATWPTIVAIGMARRSAPVDLASGKAAWGIDAGQGDSGEAMVGWSASFPAGSAAGQAVREA
jgi:hypothetical protein